MRFLAAIRVLAVSLTVGLVAAKPRNRLQVARPKQHFSTDIRYRESFTVDETIPVGGFIDLNFLNRDSVACKLSATGPCEFGLAFDALLANGEENFGGGGANLIQDKCKNFTWYGPMDRTKASLFYILNEDQGAAVRVTGGCTFSDKWRGLRAPATTGLKPLQRQTKEGENTQTTQENMVVVADSFLSINLGEGVTSIAWDLSPKGANVTYSLFRTEQWEEMAEANLFDNVETNDKDVVIECLSLYSSTYDGSLEVDASVPRTFVIFNDDEQAAVRVSGKITTSKQ